MSKLKRLFSKSTHLDIIYISLNVVKNDNKEINI